jgi:hypothetical protein
MKTMKTLLPVSIHIARTRTPRIIQTRWLFKSKAPPEPRGEQVVKARLVCRGFQESGLSKENVFAPTVAPATLRIMVTIALSLRMALGLRGLCYCLPQQHRRRRGAPVRLPAARRRHAGLRVSASRRPLRPRVEPGALVQHGRFRVTKYGLQQPSGPALVLDARQRLDAAADPRTVRRRHPRRRTGGRARALHRVPAFHAISAHQTRYATDLLEDLGMGNCIPRLSPLPAGHTLLGADESELLAPEAAAWYRASPNSAWRFRSSAGS